MQLRFLTPIRGVLALLCLCSCNVSQSGNEAGSLGPLHPFEFIPAEIDEMADAIAKDYKDSVAEAQEEHRLYDSAERAEVLATDKWLDSITKAQK